MITLGILGIAAMLLFTPILIPSQGRETRTRFDEIVSMQRRGIEDKLRDLSDPRILNEINMKGELNRAIKKLQQKNRKRR